MGRRVQRAGAIVDLHVGLDDLPGFARFDELGRIAKRLALPPLKADLHDAVLMFLGRFDHRPAFAHVVRQRLFRVHVQAVFQAGDQLQRVPVRRRGDDDHVQVRLVQHLRVQLERLRLFALQLVEFGNALVQVLAVHVADRGHFDPADLERRLGVDHPVPADADDAHLQRFVIDRLLAMHGTNKGQRPGCRGSTEERTSSRGCHRFILSFSWSCTIELRAMIRT